MKKQTMLLSLAVFISLHRLFASPPATTEFIKIDQFGYRLLAKKVAIIADPQVGFNSGDSFNPGSIYKIKRWSDDVEVFSGTLSAWNGGATHAQSGDKVWWFDFSALTTAGDYYVFDPTNNVGSYRFSIAENVYLEPLKKATKMFYYQRCGVVKPASHAGIWGDIVCHNHANQDANCRLVSDPTNAALEKNLSGGWHDAGDYNKYVNFCYGTLHDMLFAFQENSAVFGDNWDIPESGNGIPDLLDEMKIELDWLFKMQLADGSCLMKVSMTDFSGASPASADLGARRYGAAQASATRVVCSIFAHASIIYANAGQTTYANTLLQKSELAWAWIVANPATSSYNNNGFLSANPEISAYEQEAVRTCAAAFLFAKTGNSAYKTYFDTNYANIHAMAWTFWYEFEQTFQDALLYYTSLAGATASVSAAIKANCLASMNGNNPDFLAAWTNNSDAYRAYLRDANYVWGSNKPKCSHASQYLNMLRFDVGSAANQVDYAQAAEENVHFLHGANPISLAMMTQVETFGGENGLNEMYSVFYGDGTVFDLNPPPGYIPGGFNDFFTPDGACGCTITPPQNQPPTKSFKDWNTSWPQNSWELTEPAIYTNASYIRLISKYVASAVLPVEWTDFFGNYQKNGTIQLDWATGSESRIGYFEVEKQNFSTGIFEKIGQVTATGNATSANHYQFLDKNPSDGQNHYRLKTIDFDGKTDNYSKIIVVLVETARQISLSPNPATHYLDVSCVGFSGIENARIRFFSADGRLVLAQNMVAQQPFRVSLGGLLPGVYAVEVLVEGQLHTEKLVIR